MSTHASLPDDASQVVAARLITVDAAARKFLRAVFRPSGRPHHISLQWMAGISAIVVAALLFLASALSLGVMLHHLRTQVRYAEQVQSLALGTRSIEDSLADAAETARNDQTGRAPGASTLIGYRSQAIAKRLDALAWDADPASRQNLRAIAPLVERQLADLAAGRFGTEASRALAEFRQDRARALEAYRADTDRQFLTFIALALVLALIGPGLGLVGIGLLQRDRGHRKSCELQAELMHVQRLAVMGETAAMLAHEVSHPLAAASNYLAVQKRTAVPSDCAKLTDLNDRAMQQIHRAAAILGRLRRFIEKRDSERAAVAPAVLIQDAVALLGPIEGDIAVTIDVAQDLPEVAIDRVQIQQVLINLIRNAVDAMRGRCGSRLAISAAAIETGGVEFGLSDTGPGLSPEVAARLFQPFVTTKPEGMGVGLSICRSIIAEHQGTIWAEPNPDGGTVFRFRLPAA